MSNPYYTVTGSPATASSGSSAVIRAEFAAIQAAFNLLPTLAGNGSLAVFVNAGGTALEAANLATAQTRLGIVSSNELNGLANLNAVGIIARTGNGTYASRTLTGTANQIAVANGNGAAGNQTISLPTPFNTPGDFGVTGNANVVGTLTAIASVLNTLNVNNAFAASLNVNGVSTFNTLAANNISGATGSFNGNISGVNLNITGALRGTSAMMSPLNSPLNSSFVNLTNQSVFFDGPSVSQGNNGTWFASGTITVQDIAGSGDTILVKLWDGTSIISQASISLNGTGPYAVSLSGLLTAPSGNIRMSARDPIFNNMAAIQLNNSALTAFRIG